MLAIEHGESWKRDDVRREYRRPAEKFGTPRCVLCDGVEELPESVDVLSKPGREVIVLRDLKHFAANRSKQLVGNREALKSFRGRMGRAGCRFQQTELAQLRPPSLKTKACL